MASVYLRGDSSIWWLSFTENGKRKLKSSGTKDKKQAEALLRAILRKLAANKAAGITEPEAMSVERYATEVWIPSRERLQVVTWKDERSRLKHAYPHVGHLLLRDVHRTDLVRMMGEIRKPLQNGKTLAPRTQLHVYRTLQAMFDDALVAGLIDFTPCTLKNKRGELPAKVDKDPLWRPSAIFTADEVERLISLPQIPPKHRMAWALVFLTGMRIGEVAARRWRDYDTRAEPLGRITVATQWRRKERRETKTKTGAVREVPVHPTLASLLASWRLTGWETEFGRKPEPGDFIVPGGHAGTPLDSSVSLEWLHADLEAVGLRPRRQHDARRTFITIARAAGASDLLRWVTHGAKGDIIDAYTTPPWPSLCAEVAKVPVRVLTGELQLLRSPLHRES